MPGLISFNLLYLWLISKKAEITLQHKPTRGSWHLYAHFISYNKKRTNMIHKWIKMFVTYYVCAVFACACSCTWAEGEGLYVNSNVYTESHTKTTCNTSKIMLNVLKAQILVVTAFLHRFTCCCFFYNGHSSVSLTAANHCKLSMWRNQLWFITRTPTTKSYNVFSFAEPFRYFNNC